MKTTDEIMRRPWRYRDYPYRAIDLDTADYYYKRTPDMGHSAWHLPSFPSGLYKFSSVSKKNEARKKWAYENWKNSLQSFEDYQNLTKP